MPESVPLASHITRRAFEVNGMDDQYFGPKQPRPADPKKRYTGGYFPDPKTAGGYRENFVTLDPSKPLAETSVRPIKLPPTLARRPNADPASEWGGTRRHAGKLTGKPVPHVCGPGLTQETGRSALCGHRE